MWHVGMDWHSRQTDLTVRDEAHRFAQHYHHIRRRKRALDEET